MLTIACTHTPARPSSPQWLTGVIQRCLTGLQSLKQALLGNVVMTPHLAALAAALHTAEVPAAWLASATGDDLSWHSDSLAEWYDGLLKVRRLPTHTHTQTHTHRRRPSLLPLGLVPGWVWD